MSNNNNKLICRGCLSDKQELLNSLLDNPNLMELYASCTHLQVNYNDLLPKNLCSTCVNQCFSWNSFKEMCTINESVLFNQLDEQKSIGNPMEMLQPTMTEETIKVEFEEITIKNEILSSDELYEEITMNSGDDVDDEEIQMLDDTESSSDSGNWNSTTEVVNHSNDKHVEDDPLHQENGMSIECDECGEKFKNKRLIKVHMNKKHIKLNCPHCGINFKSKSNFTRHLNNNVCRMKCEKINCPHCGISFKSKGNLYQHLKKKSCRIQWEKKNININCPHCGISFESKENLNYHLNKEECRKKCKVCGEFVQSTEEINDHMTAHMNAERPYSCPVCNFYFTSTFHLGEHIKMHINRAVNQFPCTKCDKVFNKKSLFERHVQSHLNDKPFLCSICGKGFKCSSNLGGHIRIHSDVKTHNCTRCDKGFFSSYNLKKHMTTHDKKST